MSAIPGSPGAHHLAAELGQRKGAVAALVTLRSVGSATLHQLGAPDGSECGVWERDLNWLAAVGLVQRDPAGTWDACHPSTTYRLSDMGRALATSLAALAAGLG